MDHLLYNLYKQVKQEEEKCSYLLSEIIKIYHKCLNGQPKISFLSISKKIKELELEWGSSMEYLLKVPWIKEVQPVRLPLEIHKHYRKRRILLSKK